MKLIGLNGKDYNTSIAKSKYIIKSERKCKSNLQYKIGQKLIKILNGFTVLEEFNIPGTKLKVDFFVPRLKLAIEVQGIQHYKFNKFYYKSIENFKRQQANDKMKEAWCILNGIRLECVDEENIEYLDVILLDK